MAQKFTEAMVQPALSQWLADYRCWIENFHWAYESDILALDWKGRWTDFEIKCSKADFLKDFKKGEQNQEAQERSRKYWEEHGWGDYKGTPLKHEIYSGSVPFERWFPNYLVFVLPKGMIDPADVPKYAGILEYDNDLRFSVARRKKRLNDLEMPHAMVLGALTSLSYRMRDARRTAQYAQLELKALKKGV